MSEAGSIPMSVKAHVFVSWDFRVHPGEVALRRALISAPIGLMARPEFVRLENPLATNMLGESASVEIQVRQGLRSI
jgi:hypothetical protein